MNSKVKTQPKISHTTTHIGKCPHCKKSGMTGQVSFLVTRTGRQVVYMCEACGTTYSQKPR